MINRKLLLFGMLIVILLAVGCQPQEEVTEETFVPVEVTEITPDTIENILSYAGQTKAKQSSQVFPKTSGEVKEVFFDLGDAVNEGDVLFSMDEKSIQDQIRQLEAQLAITNAGVNTAQTTLKSVSGGQVESQLLQLETGLENARTGVENAKAGVENAALAMENAKIGLNNAELTLNDVRLKYENTQTLYNAGAVAKADYDAITLAYQQAQASYSAALHNVEQTTIAYEQAQASERQAQNSQRQAEDALSIYAGKTTKESTDTAQSAVAQAQASRQSVQVQLAIARETLADTNVKSPITGVVGAKKINAKDTISPAVDAYTIADISTVTVEVKVSEQLIALIAPGQQVEVLVNSASGQPFTGTVQNTSPVADSTSTYTVNIEIANTDGKIKPGMFAEVKFIKERQENTVVVPRNTVVENEDETVVFVVEGEQARKVPVTTGVDNGVSIEILTGVSFGDQVVTTGQTYLEDGSKVNVIDPDETAARTASAAPEASEEAGEE